MLLHEQLVQEYLSLVNNYYPESGKLLRSCYVKILECYITRSHTNYYYLGIYYPRKLEAKIKHQNHIKALREIAENMGFIQVVFFNADKIIRDPLSELKRDNPRLWLEIYWIAVHYL